MTKTVFWMVIACKILNGLSSKCEFYHKPNGLLLYRLLFYGFDYVNYIFGRISSTFIKHNDSFLFFEACSLILAQLLCNTAILVRWKYSFREIVKLLDKFA